jgi:hypothetical protein
MGLARISLLAALASVGWSVDLLDDPHHNDDPRLDDLRSSAASSDPGYDPLNIGFGERLSFDLHPFSGTGPYHFNGLTSNPYYARYKDVEYGIRIGLAIALGESVRVGIQIPYTANPTAMTPDPTGEPSTRSGYGHLDAALGVEWRF